MKSFGDGSVVSAPHLSSQDSGFESQYSLVLRQDSRNKGMKHS